MPTYEYRCPDGHEFESFVQKMSDAKAEMPCPSCGRASPRRVSAGSGFVFKGSGFYITDYGKDGKKDQRDAAAKGKEAAAGAAAPASADPVVKGTAGAAAPAAGAPGAASGAAPTAAPANASAKVAAPPASGAKPPKSGPDQ
jgi:putative FmdB family regulatory protein